MIFSPIAWTFAFQKQFPDNSSTDPQAAGCPFENAKTTMKEDTVKIRRWVSLMLVVPAAIVLAQPITGTGSDDGKAVRSVVDGYFKGFVKTDFDMLAKSFHPDCDIFRIDDRGKIEKYNVSKWYKGLKMLPPDVTAKMNPEMKIVAVDVVGTAASVKATIRFPQNTYTDFLTLLKSDGKWMIVTKTLSMEKHVGKAK